MTCIPLAHVAHLPHRLRPALNTNDTGLRLFCQVVSNLLRSKIYHQISPNPTITRQTLSITHQNSHLRINGGKDKGKTNQRGDYRGVLKEKGVRIGGFSPVLYSTSTPITSSTLNRYIERTQIPTTSLNYKTTRKCLQNYLKNSLTRLTIPVPIPYHQPTPRTTSKTLADT